MTQRDTIEIVKKLKEVGLKQNESEIYLFLLQNGISTPPQISRGTHIARTNCYNILNSLKEKDVVEEENRGKKKLYFARNPTSLKLNLEKRLESANRLLPDLEAEYVVQKNKPSFRFYSGWKEVREIYEMSLGAKEMYAIGSVDGFKKLDEKFFDYYVKNVNERGIIFHDIMPRTDKDIIGNNMQNPTKQNYDVSLIPEEYGLLQTDMLIWDDHIALINLKEPVFGTIVTNAHLAQTFKTISKIIADKL